MTKKDDKKVIKFVTKFCESPNLSPNYSPNLVDRKIHHQIWWRFHHPIQWFTKLITNFITNFGDLPNLVTNSSPNISGSYIPVSQSVLPYVRHTFSDFHSVSFSETSHYKPSRHCGGRHGGWYGGRNGGETPANGGGPLADSPAVFFFVFVMKQQIKIQM